MPPEVHYPDLVAPPGWISGRQLLQVRFVPPDAPADDPDATIVVSPLVPRQPLLPPAEQLIEDAIFAEERTRFEIVTKKGPTAERTASGLSGVSFEVLGYPRPRWPREKRVYVMYADEICYYAVSYLAREEAFEEYLAAFWASARSLRPFRGRLVRPTAQSPTATLYSD